MKAVLVSLLLLPFAALAAGTNDALTLLPPYGELRPTFWDRHSLVNLVVVPFLSAVAAAVVMRFFRREPAKVPAPEKIAREALTKLLPEPEDGNVLSTVSQTLRRYVSQRFNLPDGELTTAEFISILVRTNKLEASASEAVCGFLRECDVRKFSPTKAATPLEAVKRALELVELVEKYHGAAGPATSHAGSSGASPHQTAT